MTKQEALDVAWQCYKDGLIDDKYDDDVWYGIDDDWDANFWIDDSNPYLPTLTCTIYPVVDGQTITWRD